MSGPAVHGLIGEFAAPDGIVAAARQLNDSGFRRIDAYTPYPVPQLDQILPSAPRVRLPLIVVAGGLARLLAHASAALGLQALLRGGARGPGGHARARHR